MAQYKPRFRVQAAFCLIALFSGCATDIRQHHRYYKAAITAQNSGHWDAARQAWARVIDNSRTSGATLAQKAVYHYEYGRVLGVTCFYAKAEAELLQAYQLDMESGGPTYMPLTELARLHLEQRNYTKAAQYFEHLLSETDNNVLLDAPMEHAVILDEYAIAVAGLGDDQGAIRLHQQAASLRVQHPNRQSSTERTPYGKHCP